MIRTDKLNWPRWKGFAKLSMWFLAALFLLNTVGNILAISTFEKFFALITATSCFKLKYINNTNRFVVYESTGGDNN